MDVVATRQHDVRIHAQFNEECCAGLTQPVTLPPNADVLRYGGIANMIPAGLGGHFFILKFSLEHNSGPVVPFNLTLQHPISRDSETFVVNSEEKRFPLFTNHNRFTIEIRSFTTASATFTIRSVDEISTTVDE